MPINPLEALMNTVLRKSPIALAAVTLLAGLLAAGATFAADIKVKLSGDQEVPPVQTQASGSGTITVNDDKSVSGSVTTTGIKATAAHIHEAAAGKNGPVAIPLEKKSDNEFAVPAGAKLSDAQYKALKAGNLYVNVHSDAHKNGEIRAQLKP
jgi:biopolymer transport protein ExbD